MSVLALSWQVTATLQVSATDSRVEAAFSSNISVCRQVRCMRLGPRLFYGLSAPQSHSQCMQAVTLPCRRLGKVSGVWCRGHRPPKTQQQKRGLWSASDLPTKSEISWGDTPQGWVQLGASVCTWGKDHMRLWGCGDILCTGSGRIWATSGARLPHQQSRTVCRLDSS